MSTILLSIGSNTFAKTNIDKAKRMLTRLFPGIIFSQPILTEPDDEKYSYLFRNVLAKVETVMVPEEIIDKIKQTERAVGRTPKDKYLGKVVIDIDLIKYNDEILRPLDYQREYVQQLLSSFADTPPADVTPAKETSPAATPANEVPANEDLPAETPAAETPPTETI
ncbi:MAG: 2-amino-4-hydroxy-6-hydroxymethyldihydropteridine diphosphokinase [Proteiniphilum sp.]|nr:2-amino-4-hydroxy-6-hydroxymethyldihydropteridine diphosphokinase [Proteiniphilum sp.]